MSLAIEAIVAQKGDIALSEEPRCGISQVKSQVEEKVCASSLKPRCDKSQFHSRFNWEERPASQKEIPVVNQNQEKPRMLQNLVEDT